MSQLFWNAILRKVGKMTWSNFIFVSEKKEPCCGFMNLNGIFFFLIELQSHFFNAKVNGFQMAKIRKKKNGKENRDE